MFASKLKKYLKRLSRLAPVRCFVRRQDGAVAVEFGLVMLPFLTLMFVIAETALVFFAGQTLETAASDSARLIMTGQADAQKLDQTTFKTAVCARIFGLFDCASGMYVDVKTYAPGATISNTVPVDSAGKPVTSYQPGAPGDIVVVRLIYQWPIVIPLVEKFLADPSTSTRTIVATIAFRNEPYK